MNMHSLFDEPFQPRQIELRPYQEGAISSMRAEMATGARKIVLASPTGSGKTEIGMSIIMKNQLKGSTAWFIVDRVTLIDQTSERFFAHGIDHGIIQGDNRLTDYSKPVQIASAQTLARRSIRKLPDLRRTPVGRGHRHRADHRPHHARRRSPVCRAGEGDPPDVRTQKERRMTRRLCLHPAKSRQGLRRHPRR